MLRQTSVAGYMFFHMFKIIETMTDSQAFLLIFHFFDLVLDMIRSVGNEMNNILIPETVQSYK